MWVKSRHMRDEMQQAFVQGYDRWPSGASGVDELREDQPRRHLLHLNFKHRPDSHPRSHIRESQPFPSFAKRGVGSNLHLPPSRTVISKASFTGIDVSVVAIGSVAYLFCMSSQLFLQYNGSSSSSTILWHINRNAHDLAAKNWPALPC